MTQENLIERLMVENDEFRRLRSEHQSYSRTETLAWNAPLSTDQQWRMSELKKLKLMAKDGWSRSSGTRAQRQRLTRRRPIRPRKTAATAASAPFDLSPRGAAPHGGRVGEARDRPRGRRPPIIKMKPATPERRAAGQRPQGRRARHARTAGILAASAPRS